VRENRREGKKEPANTVGVHTSTNTNPNNHDLEREFRSTAAAAVVDGGCLLLAHVSSLIHSYSAFTQRSIEVVISLCFESAFGFV
jgi:hypothetical protein